MHGRLLCLIMTAVDRARINQPENRRIRDMNHASLRSRAHRCAHRLSFALLFVVVAALALPAASAATNAAADAAPKASTDKTVERARALLESSNQFWSREFSNGGSYSAAQLNLFKRGARGVCGETTGALIGPFYCYDDMTVDLDRDFLDQVAQRLSGDSADYALAYVIGHEMGLHIQDLVGTTDLVQQARDNSSPALSARTWMTAELQADCYAGLWLRSAVARHEVKAVSDPGAVLDAVSAVSSAWQSHLSPGETMDDPLLTYGTAAQRLQWFERGRDSGRFNDCDTFSAGAAGKL
jgi:uncharacterized protein